MVSVWVCFFLSTLLLSDATSKKSYSGYQVIKAIAQEALELNFLLEEAEANRVNILNNGPGDHGSATVTFAVSPDLADEFKQELNNRLLAFRVMSTDLQREIDLERVRSTDGKSGRADPWFDDYHTFEEILVWLDEQSAICGSLCSTFDIGNSYEGRPLRVLKITGAPNSCQQKPSIWIDANIHAREWIAPSTAMFITWGLIHEYATDPLIQSFRDTYDFYILTSVNPDGYAFTWSDDRLWRKSRQPNAGSGCIGTDVNRNFDFQWMTVGASDSPCSETYAGPFPYSEPEAQAVADFVSSLSGAWDLFWTLHTYGQLYMSPWGYTDDLPPNYDAMERVGEAAVQTILETHGETYTFGTSAQILYLSSGTSRDWAAGVPLIPFVYTLELRDTNSFVLPPDQIVPTGEEIWAALKTTISTMQLEKPPTCVN